MKNDVYIDDWLWFIASVVFLPLTIFLCTGFAFVLVILGIPNVCIGNLYPFKLAWEIFIVPYVSVVDNFKNLL